MTSAFNVIISTSKMDSWNAKELLQSTIQYHGIITTYKKCRIKQFFFGKHGCLLIASVLFIIRQIIMCSNHSWAIHRTTNILVSFLPPLVLWVRYERQFLYYTTSSIQQVVLELVIFIDFYCSILFIISCIYQTRHVLLDTLIDFFWGEG